MRLPLAMVAVAWLWSTEASGVLYVPGVAGGRRQLLRLNRGGLVDRADFMHLNAALRGDLVGFREVAVSGPCDFEGVGRMVFERARALVATAEAAGALPWPTGLRLHAPVARLDALPLGGDTRIALERLSRWGGQLPRPPAADVALDLRTLLSLDLIGLGVGGATVGARVLSTSQWALESVSFELDARTSRPPPAHSAWLHEEVIFLGGVGEEHTDEVPLGQHVGDDPDDEQEALLVQARLLGTQGAWRDALATLRRAQAIRFDHPGVLAALAVARLQVPGEPGEDPRAEARRHVALARTLDPGDPDVQAAARALERFEARQDEITSPRAAGRR